jgi:molybdate transport system ATP-binding protein
MRKNRFPPPSLITLDRIAIRVRDTLLFTGACWRIDAGQSWAVIGPNGAGKTSLVKAIAGMVPVVAGRIRYHGPDLRPDAVGYLSFEAHRDLIAREEMRDESRFYSRDWSGFLSVRQLLLSAAAASDAPAAILDRIGDRLGICGLYDRPVRRLSTGEFRRVMVARETLRSPRLFILDEPFEGLDPAGRRQLRTLIDETIVAQIPVILVTHRLSDIPPSMTHLLVVKDGRVVYRGRRPATLHRLDLERLYGPGHRQISDGPSLACAGEDPGTADQVLIEMRAVTVRYGSVTVLDQLNWTVRANQNWAIVGPNGAGKTTLLNLVAGDNHQAYANAIDLFGRRRGSGETLWDIKQHLGLVSSEFQIRYRKKLRAVEVVLSGFFDSVGLYRQASCRQCRHAMFWMKVMQCDAHARRYFLHLSQGEQRRVLLARAMVKSPRLLILDEPCQGLDRSARRRFLEIIDRVGGGRQTCLLYVTHDPAEIPACTTNILRFEKAAAGGYRIRQESLRGRHG